MIQRMNERNQPMVLLFIDYSKAFDSVEHEFMWKALDGFGITPHMMIRIKAP